MTSTISVQNEIERFLRSTEPEVLCITGDWGVGKTYNWQLKFDQMRSRRQIGLTRYSYVSLFGISSLDGLKQSIFENMQFILPEGRTSFDRMVGGANKTFQQGKKLVGAASAIPVIGTALSKATQPFLFSSIFNQIICVDDLERSGKDLTVKDVFGLISYLKEQKGCKTALLLNESKLAPGTPSANEFREYFEKVIDAKLVFSPTAAEAAAIAFPDDDDTSVLIKEYCIKLGIKNIRVMKKIERLIGIVFLAIPNLKPEIRRQIIHSLVIFGWCQFDSGANPPSLDYLREGSLARAVERQISKKATSEDEKRWDAIRTSYEFSYLDDLDLALMNFVTTSVLDVDEMRLEVTKQEAAIERNKHAGSFERSFRPLHHSFANNEEEVCQAMISGIKDNFDIVAFNNVDEVVGILNRLGQSTMADDLINFVVAKAPSGFWLHDDPFRRAVHNDRLKQITLERRKVAKSVLNFEQDLIAAAQNFNNEKIAQLAGVPPEAYLKLFDEKTGDDLSRVVLSALEFRRISNASPDMKKVVENAEHALRIIGQRSTLNALRMEKFGVSLSDPN